MRLFPLHRARTFAVCLVLICSTSLVVVSLSAHWPFAKATAASIASGRPNHFASSEPAAKSSVPTPFGNTITVNSTSDAAISNDGLCTLREAITAANTNTASGVTAGECAAGGSGSDTITFTIAGTINLASALPDITSNISINGPGSSSLTVRRNTGGDYRIFTVSGSTTSMSGITVTNGKP